MKKYFFLVVVMIMTLAVNAQFGYNLGVNSSNYKLKTDKPLDYSSVLTSDFEIGYYFKNNYGVFSGAYMNDRIYYEKNDTISGSYVQIPFLITKKLRLKDSRIGFSEYIGYSLTLPYQISSTVTNNYDIGLIHSLIFNISFDFWLSDKVKIYTGFNGSYDIFNNNSVRFLQYSTVYGIGVYFSK